MKISCKLVLFGALIGIVASGCGRASASTPSRAVAAQAQVEVAQAAAQDVHYAGPDDSGCGVAEPGLAMLPARPRAFASR